MALSPNLSPHLQAVISFHTPKNSLTPIQRKEVTQFLYSHLGKYGDPEEHISLAIDYALSQEPGKGGLIATATLKDKIAGAVVVNKTGMEKYIPENILVYIAIDKNTRGRGIGKKLMTETLHRIQGDIALHVEPQNPARKLFESLGFTNKYLEMRYLK